MQKYYIEKKQELIENIDKFLCQNKQEMVDTLLHLMRIPSVRGEGTKDAPYGKGCDDMLNATAALFEKHSFQTVKRNDLGYTYSLFDNHAEKTVGAYCHGDVVSVEGEWLMCPPFEPVIKDGFIFGRGCNDDKSGIVEMLYAAKFIRDFHLPFKSNILLFTGVNEETGMGDIQAFVQNEKMTDAALIIDGGSYPSDMGERSLYRFYLTSKTPFDSIKSFKGEKETTYNIVLPKAEVILGYDEGKFARLQALIADNDAFEIRDNGKEITLISHGCAAPVTHPDEGLNAGILMAELLLKSEDISEQDKRILQDIYDFISDSYGKGFNVEHTDSRFGRLTSGNGYIDMVGGRIKLSFDMRIGTEFPLKEVIARVLDRVQDGWEYSQLRASEGYIYDEENSYRKGLAEGYKLLMGEDVALGGDLMSGATHARYLKNAFPISNQDRRFTPAYPMPQGHGSYHQPDEKLYIDAFIGSVKVLIFLLLGLDDVVNT